MIRKKKRCKACGGSGEGEKYFRSPGFVYPPCPSCDGTGLVLSQKERWRKAAEFKMPFGKYADQKLDAIAASNDGLKYLAWLRNVRKEEGRCSDVDAALERYLSDKTIQKELEAIS